MSSTLYIGRILEVQAAATSPVDGSPCGRVVVECVTIHPDAGMPPTPQEGGEPEYEPNFVSMLLADSVEPGGPEVEPGGPEVEPGGPEVEPGGPERIAGEKAIRDGIIATRRLHTVDIGFDDRFWETHRDAWWANEPVAGHDTLRDWFSGPSDGAPYQVVAFEAYLDLACLHGIEQRSFDSTAFW